jgi:lipoprotein-releasing system permease protein
LNFELFIAKRLHNSKLDTNYYSGPISNICIFAICISVAVMIITTSAGIGLQSTIKEKIRLIESDIIISSIVKKESGFILSAETQDIIKSIENINSTYSVIKKMAIISHNNNIENIILKGVPSNYKPYILKEHMIDGHAFNKKNEIIISLNQANNLNLKVSDSCLMYFLSKNNNFQKRKFIISGIYNTDSELFNSTYAFIDIKELSNINNWEDGMITNYEISLSDYSKRNSIVDKLNKNTSYNLITETVENKFPALFNWIKLFDKNIIFILIIMLFICIINITNTLLILIMERLKMIGILKAIGCSNLSILKIFLYSSYFIILKGIVLGNIIGLSICAAQHFLHVITLDAQSYFISYIPIDFNIKIIIMISLITFTITHITILIPYVIIRKITPNKLLNTT